MVEGRAVLMAVAVARRRVLVRVRWRVAAMEAVRAMWMVAAKVRLIVVAMV